MSTNILPPTDLSSNLQIVLRWIHLVAGITWLGLLYFFNLISPQAVARLEPAERPRFIRALMPRAMWWFRWSALVTVLAGLVYWILILNTEPPNIPGYFTWITVGDWLVELLATWIALFLLLQIPAVARSGWLFGVMVAALVGAFLQHFLRHNVYPGASNRMVSIGLGGAIGFLLLLNVWGIVWPAQKRLIRWAEQNPGGSPPPELAKRIRQAQLVSRASFWLSFPLLFFMAAASHYPMFGG